MNWIEIYWIELFWWFMLIVFFIFYFAPGFAIGINLAQQGLAKYRKDKKRFLYICTYFQIPLIMISWTIFIAWDFWREMRMGKRTGSS